MKTRTQKILMDDYGSYLGRAGGCLVVRHSDRTVEKFPLFSNEVGEIQISMGNSCSVTALATAVYWGIDLVITTDKGHPIAVLKSLEDDSHVKTRISQYEAIKNGKGKEIAKQTVLAKIKGQNSVLRKYGLRQHDLMKIKEKLAGATSRNGLITIEGHATDFYFQQIFKLLPKGLKIENRRTFKAFDGTNNLFNICYTLLKWKCHRAIIRAKMEPFLGFLHSEQFSKPSLVCDLMEPYRFLIDQFVIEYCKGLKKKDFMIESAEYSHNRRGERQYLKKAPTKEMMKQLNLFFETTVEIPRVRHGSKQTLETLINEESLLLARYLRNELKSWVPRVASADNFGKIKRTAKPCYETV